MKDTFYFPHDFGARNDPKLQNVLMDHGCEGLGIFWCIVEQLYEQGGLLKLSYCKSIAFALHVECTVVESVINDYSLFENDGENFWSVSINNRLSKRDEIVKKRKNAALRRWEKPENSANDANAMQVQCKSNANAMQNDAKEIKEKESKVNIYIEREGKNVETAKRFQPPSFDEVNSYIIEKGYSVSAETFIAFYQSKDWFVGKNKMKDWRAALVTWEKRNKGKSVRSSSTPYSDEEIWGKS